MSSNFNFFEQQAIESLPRGHSWMELARTTISRTISSDLTDIDILACAYCIIMEKGQSNEIMIEARSLGPKRGSAHPNQTAWPGQVSA
jgi:hypothetical protein